MKLNRTAAIVACSLLAGAVVAGGATLLYKRRQLIFRDLVQQVGDVFTESAPTLATLEKCGWPTENHAFIPDEGSPIIVLKTPIGVIKFVSGDNGNFRAVSNQRGPLPIELREENISYARFQEMAAQLGAAIPME